MDCWCQIGTINQPMTALAGCWWLAGQLSPADFLWIIFLGSATVRGPPPPGVAEKRAGVAAVAEIYATHPSCHQFDFANQLRKNAKQMRVVYLGLSIS